MTRILIGGVGKAQVAEVLGELGIGGLEVSVSSDMDAALKLRTGQADYYLGTCHTGAGASLGVLLGVLGSSTCHTFGRGIPTEPEVTALLEDGKPLVVSQSADPSGDRKVRLELKATVVK